MLSHPNRLPFCGGSLVGKEKVEGMGDPEFGGRVEAKASDPLARDPPRLPHWQSLSTLAAGPRSTVW